MSQLCIFIMSGLNFERFWNLALISDVVDHQGNFPKGQATKINAIQNKVNSDIQPVFTLLRLRLFIEIWFWQDFSNVDITHHKFQTVRHALYIYQRKSPEGRLEKWLFYKHYKIGLSFLNADSCTWCCSLMDCVNYSEVTTILTTVEKKKALMFDGLSLIWEMPSSWLLGTGVGSFFCAKEPFGFL